MFFRSSVYEPLDRQKLRTAALKQLYISIKH